MVGSYPCKGEGLPVHVTILHPFVCSENAVVGMVSPNGDPLVHCPTFEGVLTFQRFLGRRRLLQVYKAAF